MREPVCDFRIGDPKGEHCERTSTVSPAIGPWGGTQLVTRPEAAKAAARGGPRRPRPCREPLETQLMNSWARTVLRTFPLPRFAACSSSQYMYSFRAANASPAVLQPAFLSTPFALLAMTSDSSDFLAIFDLRLEGLSSDCRSFYPRGRNQETFRSLASL